MNDLNLSLSNILDIIEEIGNNDLTFADRAGLFAAISTIVANFRVHIDEQLHGDAYAHEKLGGILWHVGAALGFDITNGFNAAQQRIWAFGDLHVLRGVLEDSKNKTGRFGSLPL